MTARNLAATHALAFAEDRAWSAAEFDGFLTDPACLLTGDANCFVLGRITLDEAEILTLATHPAHRRNGLARQALATFERSATNRGAEKSFLEVAEDNIGAVNLYANAGYSEVGRRKGYYLRTDGSRVAALVLAKTLGA